MKVVPVCPHRKCYYDIEQSPKGELNGIHVTSFSLYPPGQRWEGYALKAFAVMQPPCKWRNGVQVLDSAPDAFSFRFFSRRQEIEPEPSEGALYSRFMSKSLHEGGGAYCFCSTLYLGIRGKKRGI